MSAHEEQIKRSQGGRPTRAESEQLADRIADTATALFLAEGYGATSMEAVAGNAGISKRTLYSRFPDKPALFEAVIRRLVTGWRESAADLRQEQGSAQEVLQATAHRLLAISLSAENIALQRLVSAEALRFPELVELLGRHYCIHSDSVIVGILRDLMDRGKIHCDDPVLTAELFLALTIATPLRRAVLGLSGWSNDDTAHRIDTAVSLFLRGCGT